MLKIEKIVKNIKVSEERENDFKTNFIIEPLYRGYGNTVGNALRRVLLSSIPGAAIKGVYIDGVLNEFSVMDGVKEALTDIILNIKEIVVKSEVSGERKMELLVNGPKVITAADLKCDPELTIINPETVIATVTTDREVRMEFLIDTGEGFILSEELDTTDWPVGFIAIDTVYTPIKKVKYKVEDKMVGRITNFDKMTLTLETDGSVNTREAISYAVELLTMHFNPLLEVGSKMENLREEIEEEEEIIEDVEEKNDVNGLKIDELDLTVRSYNCLKKAGIKTLGELVVLNVPELLKIKNFGRKSLTEIMAKLKEYGFDLKNTTLEES